MGGMNADARIPIAAASSMAAMKTDASAAEAGAILPVMSCEALANADFTALDARIATSATAVESRCGVVTLG
jgi:hypothetical protein